MIINFFLNTEKNRIALNFISAIILFLITSLVFLHVGDLKFQMEWDDHWVVLNYYTIQGFALNNIEAVFQDFFHGQYSPFNELYYICLFELFGYNVARYHLINLILHQLNCVLVYFFLLRICLQYLKFDFAKAYKVSLLSSIIFAVHPLNVEPVAWLSASKILLYAFFYLLGLLSYFRYIENQQRIYFVLTLFMFVFSFLSKEQAVTFPVSILLLDYLIRRNEPVRAIIIEKIPFFILALIFGIITIKSQAGASNNEIPVFKLLEKIPLSSYTLVQYLTQCFIPIKLSYVYPFPFEPDAKIPNWIVIYPFLLAISMFLIRQVFLIKFVKFGFLFFLVNIFIVLNFFNLTRYSLTADRYVYLSVIGVSFVIVNAFFNLYISVFGLKRVVTIAIFILYILGLSFYSKLYLDSWENSSTLKHDLRKIIRSRIDYIGTGINYE